MNLIMLNDAGRERLHAKSSGMGKGFRQGHDNLNYCCTVSCTLLIPCHNLMCLTCYLFTVVIIRPSVLFQCGAVGTHVQRRVARQPPQPTGHRRLVRRRLRQQPDQRRALRLAQPGQPVHVPG